MKYQPTVKSLKNHKIPRWYEDAKLGIFIHWGLYSVPGWAVPKKDLEGIPEDHANTPYAEWYGNTMKIEGSPTRRFHEETYGKDFSYDDFALLFRKEAAGMDPDVWADFISRTGAGYTIFTTKHHDGFTLWPSDYPNPNKKGWGSERDYAGELSRALRERGIRPGLYYSGIWDWSFQPEPITDEYTMLINGDGSRAYGEYCFNQFKEIIDKYKPDVLYNDIGYPVRGRLKELLAHYYNTVPDGVANNRWIRWRIPDNRLVRFILKSVLRFKDRFMKVDWGGTDLKIDFGDYATPEFLTVDKIPEFKWECTRGLGSSFGYNRLEDENLLLSPERLIRLFVDIVSKNGNLAINIGPMPDGTIPENQQKPLLALGEWLERNGEAVYGSRPWTRAEGVTAAGQPVRFTRKEETLYVFLMEPDGIPSVVIRDLQISPGSRICPAGTRDELKWSRTGKDLEIELPRDSVVEPVRVLKIYGG